VEGYNSEQLKRARQVERSTGKYIYRLECEYKVTNREEMRQLGLAGKVVRIRQFLETQAAWVQYEGDIYKVPLLCLVPKTERGRYVVNMTDILNSALMQGLVVDYGQESVRQINTELDPKLFGEHFTSDTKEDELFNYIDLVYFPSKNIKGPAKEAIKLRLGIVPRISHQKHGEVRVMKGTINQVIDSFENRTGKNVWNILKTISLLEYPLCMCGSVHQEYAEAYPIQKVVLMCEGCKSLLFGAVGMNFQTAEPAIEALLERNKNIRK
jgi:hypothetical protein